MATLRAQEIAQDRHRQLEAIRIAKDEQRVVSNLIGDVETYLGRTS